MAYKMDMFNVTFLIIANDEREKEIIETWWQYFTTNKEMGRVSVVLAFLKNNDLQFQYKWRYCNRLSLMDNMRAAIGFRKQIKNFEKSEKL